MDMTDRHVVVIPIEIYEAHEDDMLDWLHEYVGSVGDLSLWHQWGWRRDGEITFSFRYVNDAMAFKLAWI